jgi:hypothetical protein
MNFPQRLPAITQSYGTSLTASIHLGQLHHIPSEPTPLREGLALITLT